MSEPITRHNHLAIDLGAESGRTIVGSLAQGRLSLGDGGHCMTFHDFGGNLWLTFHQPNGHPHERPKFLPLAEEKRLHTT